MPWKTVIGVDERMHFITQLRNEDESFAALCRQHGISRKTGYKWMARYEAAGPAALEDRASVAIRNGRSLSDAIVEAVVSLRREHPTWGPKKLRARLQAVGVPTIPSCSAIGDTLKRHGLVRPRRRRPYAPREATGLTLGEQPNDVWCVDFKGDFALGDRSRCYPLTITDFVSRYLLDITALTSTKEEPVATIFHRVFKEFGMPSIIRSDNGVPFSSVGLGGLTRLSIGWIKLGITPERTEPGHPEQNGRHERMHRTLKAEATKPPAADLQGQQRMLDRFRHVYNDVRPHESLGQRPPVSVYSVSKRTMPAEGSAPTYESPLSTRRLDVQGRLSIGGRQVTLTPLLAREEVGVEETHEGAWDIWFGPLFLARLRRSGRDVVLDRGRRASRAALML